MMRFCSGCRRQFTPQDLDKEESKEMEGKRRDLGLEGARFLYYQCPDCKQIDIFVHVLPLDGESEERLHARRAALESAAQSIHKARLDVVVSERGRP